MATSIYKGGNDWSGKHQLWRVAPLAYVIKNSDR